MQQSRTLINRTGDSQGRGEREAFKPPAKINYRRLSGLVSERYPFRARHRNSAHTLSFLPEPRAALAPRPAETNSRPFFCSVPCIYSGVSPSVRGACSAPRKRRREEAVGWSVRFLDVVLRLVTGRDEMGREKGGFEGGGERCSGHGGVSRWTRGTVGSRVRR